uniref:LysM domain-containing protein n=1 Tax=Acrobeloides nanus TaxID=290746 RepID=A0A914E0C9_9BILA
MFSYQIFIQLEVIICFIRVTHWQAWSAGVQPNGQCQCSCAQPQYEPSAAPSQSSYQPAPASTYQPAPSYQPSYQPAPATSYQPSYQPASSYQPSYQSAPATSYQPSYQPAPAPTYQPASSYQPSYQSAPATSYQPSYQPIPSPSSQPIESSSGCATCGNYQQVSAPAPQPCTTCNSPQSQPACSICSSYGLSNLISGRNYGGNSIGNGNCVTVKEGDSMWSICIEQLGITLQECEAKNPEITLGTAIGFLKLIFPNVYGRQDRLKNKI